MDGPRTPGGVYGKQMIEYAGGDRSQPPLTDGIDGDVIAKILKALYAMDPEGQRGYWAALSERNKERPPTPTPMPSPTPQPGGLGGYNESPVRAEELYKQYVGG